MIINGDSIAKLAYETLTVVMTFLVKSEVYVRMIACSETTGFAQLKVDGIGLYSQYTIDVTMFSKGADTIWVVA